MKKRFVLAGLVVLSLWAVPVFARDHMRMRSWGPGMMMGDGPGMMMPLLLKKADLTAEQKAQVRKIMENHRDTFRSLFSQLEAANQRLADKLLAPGDLQSGDLTSQIQQITQFRGQLIQEGIKAALEVRGVLTAEQLAKAAQFKDKMRTLHAEMRGLFEEQE